MTHISSIGAGMFSDLSVAALATEMTSGALAALDTAAEFQAVFANEIPNIGGTKSTATFVRIRNVREFPQIGQPANIVNVPAYGAGTSSQINGQADAPDLSVTLNYVPAEWEPTTILGGMVGDGIQRVFRFTFLNAEPTGYASTAGGLGTRQNSQFYWVGKIESLLTNPQLTDANQATLGLTMQGKFYGAYTI